MTVRARRVGAIAGLTTLMALTGCSASSRSPGSASTDARNARPPANSTGQAGFGQWPNSIVVLGHSGATGQDSDPARPGMDVPENSWATGSNPKVDSIYLRILAHNPAVKGHAVNLAKDGATVDDLMAQAREALALNPLPDLFLIQTIDNDIHCDGTDPQNYAEFGARLTSTLRVIATADPGARIFLVTQPGDVANNAAVAATNPAWIAQWQGDGPCDAFDAAGKRSPAHIAQLQDITDHYFAEQAASCRRVPHCQDDGNAWQRMVVTAADFAEDGNHASIPGMARRAAVTWAALKATGHPAQFAITLPRRRLSPRG